MKAAFLAVMKRQPLRLSWVLGLCALTGCGTAPPAGPPALSPDQEQAILDQVNQSQSQESNTQQPNEPEGSSY